MAQKRQPQRPDSMLFSRHGYQPEADIPEPLHITKRPDSRWSQVSSDSTDSVSSAGSIAGTLAGDQPLTVPKRRGNNHKKTIPSRPGSLPTPRGSPSCSVSDEVDAYAPVPQPSAGGLYMGREHVAGKRGGVGEMGSTGQASVSSTTTRNQPWLLRSALRNSRSMYHISAKATRPRESISDSLCSPSIPRSPVVGVCPTVELQQVSPLVLVPWITVTPDTQAADVNTGTLWAAVQVSTRLHRANEQDDTGRDGDNG